MKRLTVALLALLLISGCGGTAGQDVYTSQFFAMDTVMTLTVYGDNAQEAAKVCEDELSRLDKLLSTGIATSEVAKINEVGGGKLSFDTADILRKAMDIYALTDSAFDVTVYPLVEAWGFYSGEYAIPSDSEISTRLSHVGSDMIYLEGETLRFGSPGMAVDLGGIAKGYASDRVAELLLEQGIASALVSLGGNVLAYGSKPDGNPWRVAVQNPNEQDGFLGVLDVINLSVITSGGYQRFFEKDGRTYHHIIDPQTGWPSDSDLVSVTIVSEDGMLADGLSTALFVMGSETAIDFWRAHRDTFDAVLYLTDGTLLVTQGLREIFSSELEFVVIN